MVTPQTEPAFKNPKKKEWKSFSLNFVHRTHRTLFTLFYSISFYLFFSFGLTNGMSFVICQFYLGHFWAVAFCGVRERLLLMFANQLKFIKRKLTLKSGAHYKLGKQHGNNPHPHQLQANRQNFKLPNCFDSRFAIIFRADRPAMEMNAPFPI